jgi:uncharacterized protein
VEKLNRRGFIKTGITCTTGLMALKSSLGASSDEQQRNIIYRTLGKTGLKIPVISFGVMRSDNPNLCKAAYEKGIKLFDTANSYQNGNNEIMLGNLFNSYPRESFMIETKIKPVGLDNKGKPSKQTTEEAFLNSFAVSLSRLKMDYVDILYIHGVSTPEIIEHKPLINALNKLKKEGKAKYIGFSTHTGEPPVINAAASMNVYDVILTSYNFKQSYVAEIQSAIRKAVDAGIGVVAMKTLAGGGFLDRERTKPINSSAAIKWVLSNPDITTAIPGMTEFDQLDSNLELLTDISLTEAEKRDLATAQNEQGLYCTGCTKCISQCNKGLKIPDFMRAYMYAYGYSSPSMAATLLSELDINGDPCSGCDSCKVICTKKFNIREKISDISRLAGVPVELLS